MTRAKPARKAAARSRLAAPGARTKKTADRDAGASSAPGSDGPKVTVRTPNAPGYTGRVDAVKYRVMRGLVLGVMPARAPGVTQAEMMAGVGRVAPRATFPGSTHRWWAKWVQLDLEARGVLARELTKPLRWHRSWPPRDVEGQADGP